MNRTITFLRHGPTTPPATAGDIASDAARDLTPDGVKLVELVSRDLAPRDFDLMIRSRVRRTIDSGNLIAKNQNGLLRIVDDHTLFLPDDPNKAAEVAARYEKYETARQSWSDTMLRAEAMESMRTILRICNAEHSTNAVVINHNILIQMTVTAMTGHEDALDIALKPCDGMIVTLENNEFVHRVYRAPKAT
jgi:broad specificity phosphatase PhoE